MTAWLAESWALGASCAAWLLAVVVVSAAYVFWVQTYWARRGLPQTWPKPLLGDFIESVFQRRTPGQVLTEIYRKFDGEPYVGIYRFLTPVLLVRDPEVVKDVIVQNFTSFQSNAVIFPPNKDQVFSENVFTVEIEKWKDLRQKVSQHFSPSRVRVAFTDVAESAERLADFLAASNEHTTQDGLQVAKRFTAHASVRVLFGIESHSLEVGKPPGVFYDMGHTIFNGGLLTALRFIAFMNCPSFLELLGYKFVSDKTLVFFRKLILDSVEYREKEGISRDDFVQFASKQILINGKIDEESLREMTSYAINTYVETFETSGITTAAVLLMLAAHPEEQKKVREEVRQALPLGQPMQCDAVAGLVYLERVVKETLRLFPAADTVRRMCTKATTLRAPSDSGPGVSLSPGDLVFISTDAMHRDPALYLHPDEFWPDHFSDEEIAARPKTTFLAFGDGPRYCPGVRYGLQQVKAAVAAVLQRLEVLPAPEQQLPVERDPTASFLGFKGGVWLRFRPAP